MRILLLGGNGQVGRELRRSLASLGDVVAASRDGRLDDGTPGEIADLAAPATLPALVARIAPDLVVNAGAYTAVDKAETEPALAFRVNAEAPAALAAACAAAGIPLLHYSTDYVFAGDADRPYRADDPPAPLGVYGASKLAGDEAVRASGAAHKILRVSWVYAPHGRNFLRTILRAAGERDELRVVADQVGAPTPAAWIADASAEAIRRRPDATGTWHLAADGRTSWHGFASAIVAAAVAAGRLPRAPRIVPIATADWPTPARRPACSVLDTAAFAADFGLRLPDWQDGVAPAVAAAD